MKLQFWKRLQAEPRLYQVDALLILLPLLAWAAAFHARPGIIQPRCTKNPLSCTRDGVFALDQFSLGMESPWADNMSFHTQNLAGALAVILPSAWLAFRFRHDLHKLAKSCAIDLTLFIQIIAWNGIITELIRITVQRPRPFVYADPARFGNTPAHYTSFISGHTSFAAAASMSVVMALIGRKAPPLMIKTTSALVLSLTIATGVFRVLAGRHFVTDTLAGAFIGAAVAAVIGTLHRPKPMRD